MNTRALFLLTAFAALAIIATACTSDEEPTPTPTASATSSLTISDAWVRPGQDPTAIYFMVKNDGDGAIELTGADAVWADDVSMHQTAERDGLMAMEHIDKMIVPAGGTLMLEPGGYHLMAENLDNDISDGDMLNVSVTTDSNETISFMAVARSAADSVMDDGMDHNHDDDEAHDDHGDAEHDGMEVDVDDHGAIFSSGTIAPGKTFSFTFDHSFAGIEIPYHNHLDGSSATIMVMEYAANSAPANVTIEDSGFAPAQLHITVGTTVTWTNSTSVAWTVVSGHSPH